MSFSDLLFYLLIFLSITIIYSLIIVFSKNQTKEKKVTFNEKTQVRVFTENISLKDDDKFSKSRSNFRSIFLKVAKSSI